MTRTHGRRTGLVHLGLVLVLGLVASIGLSACGIPIGSAPESLPVNQIPYNLEGGLAAPAPTTTVTGNRPGSHPAGFLIYLLENLVLVPVHRTAARPTPQAALDALAEGPTSAEINAGLTSSLVLYPVPRLHLAGAVTKDGVARVTLDISTASLADPILLYQALGQIVWTLTQFCAIQEVSFSYDGRSFPAFLPNGTAPPTPVSRVDYLEIGPAATTRSHRLACIPSPA